MLDYFSSPLSTRLSLALPPPSDLLRKFQVTQPALCTNRRITWPVPLPSRGEVTTKEFSETYYVHLAGALGTLGCSFSLGRRGFSSGEGPPL